MARRCELHLLALLSVCVAPCLSFVAPFHAGMGGHQRVAATKGVRAAGTCRFVTGFEAERKRCTKLRGGLRLAMQLSVNEDEEDFVKHPPLDPLDQAELLMEADSDGYEPFEGDIVMFVSEDGDSPKLGMAVEDSRDGEVKVKELSKREGDGEFDEWKCFTNAAQTIVEVPIYNVRYVGSCTECIEEEL